MGSVPPLLSFLLMIAAGWVHRHQLIVIEFLQAENRLLKGRLRGKRIRFTEAERALLPRKAKAVGRKALLELDTIVSPDTCCGGSVAAMKTPTACCVSTSQKEWISRVTPSRT
jgi:hypothetical protein